MEKKTNKEKTRKGFTVIMKEKIPKGEASKLMEQILKNKFVKQLEGKIELYGHTHILKKLKGGKKPNVKSKS